MLKPCANCGKIFKAKGTAPVNCSAECANIRRRLVLRGAVANRSKLQSEVKTAVAPTPAPTPPSTPVSGSLVVNSYTLPPPEELPAPYAKRVYEMWLSLTGGRDAPTRIA